MITRLLKTPLNRENYNREVEVIKQIAVDNGYDQQNIMRMINNRKHKLCMQHIYKPVNEQQKWNKLTYIGLVTNKVARIMKRQNNKTNITFYNNNNLANHLKNDKDKLDKMENGGVYQLQCGSCDKSYIGRTYRNFNIRIKEHLSAYNNKHPEKSNFAEHLIDSQHIFHQQDIKVLHRSNKDSRITDTLEAIEILTNKEKVVNKIININPSPLIRLFTSS